MSIADQCNLLRTLYEKKYYQESMVRQGFKQNEQLKAKLKQFRDRKQRNILVPDGQAKQQSSPQLLRKNNITYDFEYCNQPFKVSVCRPVSYRQFMLKKQKRKSNSVSCNRDLSKTKPDNWVEDLKNSILHSRENHYLNLLNQRKSKNKLQKTLDSEQLAAEQGKYPKNNSNMSHYKTHKNFTRNTLSEVRRRTTLTVLRNRATNLSKNKSKTHQIRQDDNDVLPWNVQTEEFL